MSELHHFGYLGTPERAVALSLAMQFEFTKTGEPTDFEVPDPKGPLVHIHIYRPVIWEHSSGGARRRLPHDYVGDLAEPAHVELLIRQADNDYSSIDVYADSRAEWLMVQPIVTLFLTRLGAKKLPETAIGDLPTDSDVPPDALIVRTSDPAVPGRMIEDFLENVTSDPADPSRTIRDYLTVQSTSDAMAAQSVGNDSQQEESGKSRLPGAIRTSSGPSEKLQPRRECILRLHRENPEWSQLQVANAAALELNEEVTVQTVKNDLRAMGLKWQKRR